MPWPRWGRRRPGVCCHAGMNEELFAPIALDDDALGGINGGSEYYPPGPLAGQMMRNWQDGCTTYPIYPWTSEKSATYAECMRATDPYNDYGY